MKRLDALLILAAVLFVVAAFLVSTVLGLVVAGASCVAAWLLLDDDEATS